LNLDLVAAIAAKGYYSLALKRDGTVWAWGDNAVGQLGNGTTAASNVPVRVSGLSDVESIAAGAGHALALRSDGAVWAWGSNAEGQLGAVTSGVCVYPTGQSPCSTTPVRVDGFGGVRTLAAGAAHSLALKHDGTVWGWGRNFNGQLGDGTRQNRSTPSRTVGLGGVRSIAAGQEHSLALRPDGSVWAWGFNTSGQLGNGTTSCYTCADPVPAQVRRLAGVVAIGAGTDHSLAVRLDGSMRAWGDNDQGQLGDGTRAMRATPARVRNLTGVSGATGGVYHTVALR
jgi:alpha-tubulin suppressor-like RCC1 family protein